MKTSKLNSYRFFDPDPKVRQIAFELYKGVKDLPIISPHGHVDAKLLADNEPFPDPTELILIPDHYLFRMLYSQGIDLESLGIPTIDGTEVEKDHRKIWQVFADNYHLFDASPSSAWLDYTFEKVFGMEGKLNSKNAMKFYDAIRKKLQTKSFLPRSLFEKFNIEVLTTTDAASSSLEYHKKLRESGWNRRVIPCFRPDAAVNILSPGWKKEIDSLGEISATQIFDYKTFIKVLENRREFFKSTGCVSTDQGIESPHAHRLSESEAEAIFNRALKGTASEKDSSAFTAHMLMEMARMSADDGLVMQIHAGAMRNHDKRIFSRFGADKGGDIPVRTEYVRSMHEFLNEFGDNPKLTVVLFTLDETTYSRELAPLAGVYPAVKLGAPWWFHDSLQGMIRYRESVTETAGIYNTVGFTDDTRAFMSIPARHDLARRMDANFLAGMVARHIVTKEDAKVMARAMAYELAKKAYKL
ncbi:MAG TPA: glucuronate isomerase [Candidatus Acidoferrales bacterium]|nr:glucuronate isomerase [Candidatus Acidoferrales bacterium]